MILRLALSLLLFLVACGNGGSPEPPERIVLILVDTLRRDHVGAYGAERPTPHMDRLARDGTVFRRAVSSFHSTPTSMAALFTGRTPSFESRDAARPLRFGRRTWCGLARLAAPGDSTCLPDAVPTLAEQMRELGYRTMAVHSHPLLGRDDGFARGFQDWIRVDTVAPDEPGYVESRSGSHVNQAAIAALDARASDRFFLWVHYLDVHDWHWRGDSYAEGVARADEAVGELVGALEERGLLEDAVVVLTSDHGESLGERHFRPPRPRHAGNPSFQPVLRVPLIVHGRQLPGADRFLRGEDVFRLLVEIAGGEAPSSELGRAEQLVTERRYRVYRKGRWKSFWRRDGRPPRLVDLEADPGERRDVAAREPAVIAAHGERIEALARQLGSLRRAERAPDGAAQERLRALGYLAPAYDLEVPVEDLRKAPVGGEGEAGDN